jgi:hypothetical protein
MQMWRLEKGIKAAPRGAVALLAVPTLSTMGWGASFQVFCSLVTDIWAPIGLGFTELAIV